MRKLGGDVYVLNIDGVDIAFNRTVLKEIRDCIVDIDNRMSIVRGGNTLFIFADAFDLIVYKYKDEIFVHFIYRQTGSKVLGTSAKLLLGSAIDLFYTQYNTMFKE